MSNGVWIETYRGTKFHIFDPQPEEIDILDIAHSLALTCRYRGHTKAFYSVAQHSIEVARMLPQDQKMSGLLHDSAEAYIGDMSRPLKSVMPTFVAVEDKIRAAIFDKYGVANPDVGLIKWADRKALAAEAQVLMANMDDWEELPKAEPLAVPALSWQLAERLFLDYFISYGGKNK